MYAFLLMDKQDQGRHTPWSALFYRLEHLHLLVTNHMFLKQSGPPSRSITELGINYLALSDLFLICDKRRDMINYEIYVQMVEIYNEQVRDLLSEKSSCIRYPFFISP